MPPGLLFVDSQSIASYTSSPDLSIVFIIIEGSLAVAVAPAVQKKRALAEVEPKTFEC